MCFNFNVLPISLVIKCLGTTNVCAPLLCKLNTLISPSLAIGMSTPPPSQRNSPATSILETSSSTHAQSATYGNTPVLTPRATPPISDDTENGMSRNSSRGSLFTKGSDKRSSVSVSMPTKSLQGSQTKSSVPPSPMKTEFTSEPPVGMFKSQPVRTTARELKFDTVPESPAQSFTDNGMMFPSVSKEVDDGIDQMHSGSKETEVERRGSMDRPDLMESFSMDTLPRMMEDLHRDDDDEDSAPDDEVSGITQSHGGSESAVHLTAE